MAVNVLWTPGENDALDTDLYNAQIAEFVSKLSRLAGVVDGVDGIEFNAGYGASLDSNRETGRIDWHPMATESGNYFFYTAPITTSNTTFTTVNLPASWPGLGGKMIRMRVSVMYPAASLQRTQQHVTYADNQGLLIKPNDPLLTGVNQGIQIFPAYNAGISYVPISTTLYTTIVEIPNFGDAFLYRAGSVAMKGASVGEIGFMLLESGL